MQYVELKEIAKAIEHLRTQIPVADMDMRQEMLNQLTALRDMAGSILDAWMEVDDAIEETVRELGGNESAAPFVDADGENLVAVDFGSKVTEQEVSGEAMRRQPAWMTGPMELTEAWYDLSLKAETTLRRGLGYYDLGMYDEAASALTDAVLEHDIPATRIYLALSHMAAGRLHFAASELAEARKIAQDPITLQAILEAEVQLFALAEDWHAAIHTLYELLAFHPDKGDTWYNIGICHLRMHEYGAAERCLTHAMMYDDADEEAYLWRIFALCMTDRVEQAQGLLEWLPDDSQGLSELKAIVYLATGDVSEALASARQVSVKKQNALVGLCYLLQGRVNEAKVELMKHLTLERDSRESTMLFGICNFFLGDFARAKRALTEVSADEAPAIVDLMLGRLEGIFGNTAEAKRRLQGVTKHPRIAIRRLATLYRGMLYLEEGNTELAQADFACARMLGISEEVLKLATQTAE